MLMTVAALPDFEATIRLGRDWLDAARLAECHGVSLNDRLNKQ